VAIVALLASLSLNLQLGRMLMAAVGVSFLGFVVVATAYLVYSLGRGGIAPIGYSYLSEGTSVPWGTGVDARFLPGYYVAWIATLLSIVLALVRHRITGEPNAPLLPLKRASAAA
jgi:hypothetical protein